MAGDAVLQRECRDAQVVCLVDGGVKHMALGQFHHAQLVVQFGVGQGEQAPDELPQSHGPHQEQRRLALVDA